MSDERRERQKEKNSDDAPIDRRWRRKAIYVTLILAALAAVFELWHHSQHKYDAFARCLSDRGVKMYGAYWCPHCQEQKEKFAASFEYAPYIECGVQGNVHAESQVCKDADIKHFPTWQFPPTGERVERVFEMEELSDRTGCALP